MKDIVKFSLLLILAVLGIVVGPLITIWMLNTLFGTGIAYTFFTWLAAALLNATIAYAGSGKS